MRAWRDDVTCMRNEMSQTTEAERKVVRNDLKRKISDKCNERRV